MQLHTINFPKQVKMTGPQQNLLSMAVNCSVALGAPCADAKILIALAGFCLQATLLHVQRLVSSKLCTQLKEVAYCITSSGE